ncbi:MAG: ABC transporter permease subunit [Clostridium sp.]
MISKVKSIATMEAYKIVKGWIFIVGLICIVGGQIILDSPLVDGHLWTDLSAAYNYSHGVNIIGTFIIPLFMVSTFYNDKNTSTIEVVFTQPIGKYEYVIGKFLGGFISFILIVFIGILVNMFIPIYFGELPYSPLPFIQSFFIYTFPSMLFYASLSFIISILFKEVVIAIILPMFYLFFNDSLPKIAQYIMRGVEIGTLVNKESIPLEVLEGLILNRLFNLVVSLCLLALAIFIFNPKSYMRRIG